MQDLHLAKRFYDKAATAAPDAWLPVRVALAGLAAHSTWLQMAPRLPPQLAWLRQYVFAPPKQPGAALLRGIGAVCCNACRPISVHDRGLQFWVCCNSGRGARAGACGHRVQGGLLRGQLGVQLGGACDRRLQGPGSRRRSALGRSQASAAA